MRIRKKIDFSKVFLYALCCLGIFCLSKIGNRYEPFSLVLSYAMASASLSPALSAFFYFLSALPSWETEIILLYLGQSVLLASGFYLQNRVGKASFLKMGFFPMLTLSLTLGLFCAFAPFTPYPIPLEDIAVNAITQKIILAALLFLLSAIFSVAMKALLHKLLKCRLRDDEIVFILFSFVVIGIGFCRFFGENAYMGISFFILLLYAHAVKDASASVCAFVLSIPPFLITGLSPARFFLYGILITLFTRSGRLAAACAFLATFFVCGYLDGIYAYSADTLAQSVLSAVLPALFFILIPTPLIREMENRLIFYREKHLPRIAINRNRSAVGEQLFEISSVFREIECAFYALGTNGADEKARAYVQTQVEEEICANCSNKELCAKQRNAEDFSNLIKIGCMKGRVNLIDIPLSLSDVCTNQSDLLYALNKQLTSYRKYMTQAENAASGRAMLAKQAQGVSEILKNLALEQSEPLRLYTQKERALNVALLSVGIVCSELLVYGEESNLTLSLVTYGKANVKKIAQIATHVLGQEMIISERLSLSQDKFCCILRKKPYYDAAFGVATAIKSGETASGDTHSVIKIDEGRFMVALSDGMGSGEYAKRISECTISLLESFYRAKMPSELILSTVNKLLTFDSEETFACVDIAIVDLNNGNADVVKIGSPVGFILSGNTIKVLENGSLPLGVLDALHPNAAGYTLSENDVLLFVSDGITDAFGSTADLYEALRRIPLHNPQQLADSLLAQANQAYGGTAKDDMTAVAVRLFKNTESQSTL